MNCTTVHNLISAYIDCELPLEQKQDMRHHLLNCNECSLEYQQLLAVKNCLENTSNAPVEFDPLDALYDRIAAEHVAFVSQPSGLYWGSRILMMTACLLAFFCSTFLLFPNNSKSLAQQQLYSPESLDQNISIDQSINVYQASLILP